MVPLVRDSGSVVSGAMEIRQFVASEKREDKVEREQRAPSPPSSQSRHGNSRKRRKNNLF